MDVENGCEGFVEEFKELMRGRYALAYVLSQNLRQFRGCSPEEVLDRITGDDGPMIHRARIQTNDGELDIKVTVGTGDDILSDRFSSKQKAAWCGAYVLSKAASEDSKVCSVWFQEKPEPSKAGKAERHQVKAVSLDAVTGKTEEVHVEVVVVYRGDEPKM